MISEKGIRRARRLVVTIVAAAALAIPAFAFAGQQTTAPPPVPRPFPQPGQPANPPASTAAKPPDTAASSLPSPAPPTGQMILTPGAPHARPSAADLGNTPVYPAADYLDSYDAGHGQRYYLFGTNASYADIVAFYKKVLDDGGHEVFKTPAMQEFDLGNVKFKEDTMSFPPSVVVKDYTWNQSPGYLFADGTTEKRYKTIIQIVPPGK